MFQITFATGLLALASLMPFITATPVPEAAAARKLAVFSNTTTKLYYWQNSAIIKYILSSKNPTIEISNRLMERQGGSGPTSYVSMTCYTQTDCTGQATPHSQSFSGNSECINAANCQCMLVYDLDDAHLVYWNGQTCNGEKSILNGCFSNGRVQQSSAGTNSLGFHAGCTGS